MSVRQIVVIPFTWHSCLFSFLSDLSAFPWFYNYLALFIFPKAVLLVIKDLSLTLELSTSIYRHAGALSWLLVSPLKRILILVVFLNVGSDLSFRVIVRLLELLRITHKSIWLKMGIAVFPMHEVVGAER